VLLRTVRESSLASCGELWAGKQAPTLTSLFSLLLTSRSGHISSAYLAETAFAVGRLTGSSAAFWQTVLVLFENQSNFFNVRASGLTPIQIREEAASRELYLSSLPITASLSHSKI